MNNTYYLMRHGRSESNDLKVIACSPEKSVTGFGLTEQGSQQARQAAAQFAQKVGVTPVIFASDFLRAQQTAEAVASACKTTVTCDVRLRERDFGELDGTPSDNYHKVWDAEPDPDATPFDAESLRHQIDRIWSLVLECEQKYSGQTIVFVSHGDPMVAVNSFAMHGDMRPPIHRIGNAEIRRIDEATPTVSVE